MKVSEQLLQAVLNEARATRPERFTRYREILAMIPGSRGNAAEGVHCILTGDDEMAAVEEAQIAQHAADGFDPHFGRVGVVFEDRVSVVLAHPIKTAGGVLRTWKGIYWWNGIVGKSVAIIPYTDDGRVLLVPAWRGPVVGRWELEFPGGGDVKAKTEVDAVRGELFEEAGYEMLDTPTRLGGDEYFAIDTANHGTPIAVYAVHLGRKSEAEPEDGEVIGRPVFLNRAELEAAFRRGYVTLPGYPPERRFSVLSGRNAISAYMATINGLVR